jgi:hypothetical protein
MVWKAVVAALVLGTIAWRFVFFFAPFAWTGEPARLARVLALRPGMNVADIGAGSGALAMEMASVVGSAGQVFATELDPEKRKTIERRISGALVRNVHGADHGVQPASVVTAFQAAGLKVREQIHDWGGGMFLIVFQRDAGD